MHTYIHTSLRDRQTDRQRHRLRNRDRERNALLGKDAMVPSNKNDLSMLIILTKPARIIVTTQNHKMYKRRLKAVLNRLVATFPFMVCAALHYNRSVVFKWDNTYSTLPTSISRNTAYYNTRSVITANDRFWLHQITDRWSHWAI